MVTDVKKLPIQFDHDRVVAFCRDRRIVRLSVFGFHDHHDTIVAAIEAGKTQAERARKKTFAMTMPNSWT